MTLLKDLDRAKITFQARTIETILEEGKPMSGIEERADAEARHGNREALEKMTLDRDRLLDEIERLREALTWLDNVVETNCTPTGKPDRIQDEQGNWHSGPAADICQKVLRGLQAVSREALKGSEQ